MAFIARPKFQLRSLPIRVRWEVTRRHPYYQVYWQLARDFYGEVPAKHTADPAYRLAAVVALGKIGVSGSPPDPATEFRDLGETALRAEWLSGAVQPVTLRGLARLLMAALPKASLQAVGAVMFDAGIADVENQPPRLFTALLRLQELNGLDSFIDEPIVSINPAASARDVRKALSKALTAWKKERKLSERRSRSEKYDAYLQVWDLREGWNGASYDRQEEMTLPEVAKKVRRPVSSVSNHYRRAFELVTGYPYSPPAWMTFFSVLKLTGLIEQQLGKVSENRPRRSSSRVDVPETRLRNSPTATVNSEQSQHELFLDIEELLKKGLTPAEIVQELELSEELIAEVESMRKLIRPGDSKSSKR